MRRESGFRKKTNRSLRTSRRPLALMILRMANRILSRMIMALRNYNEKQ